MSQRIKPGATEGYTMEALCARIVERHGERIRVRKQPLAVANLARIVGAFLRLSNRKGFHATSLRELASEAGLSMGGLYSYFDSKETLLLMVLGEVSTTLKEVMDTAPADIARDPLAHLKWVIATHVHLTEKMQPWFVFAYMEAKSFPKSARNAAVDSELLAENVLADILARGNTSGAFAVSDPALTAALIKPLLQDWYVKRAKYRKRGTSIDHYVETITRMVELATRAA
ncbi:TetR/AcrR family transcriptional regulator [Aquibium oceanicum]